MSDFETFVPQSGGDYDAYEPKENYGHSIIVRPIKAGPLQPSKFKNSDGTPRPPKETIDVDLVDLDGARQADGTTKHVFRSVRLYGGQFHDHLLPYVGKLLVLTIVKRKGEAADYAGIEAADAPSMQRAREYKGVNPDLFEELGTVQKPAEQPAVAPAPAPAAQPSPEQTVAATLGATPVQEAAPAGPTEQDIIRAKALIAIPGIEDHVVLASVPGLTPAIVASLRTAAGS